MGIFTPDKLIIIFILSIAPFALHPPYNPAPLARIAALEAVKKKNQV